MRALIFFNTKVPFAQRQNSVPVRLYTIHFMLLLAINCAHAVSTNKTAISCVLLAVLRIAIRFRRTKYSKSEDMIRNRILCIIMF